MDQATRDNKNKLDYTILPWEAFEEVIKAFKQGEKDYGRGNYQKGEGLSLQSYRESMFRHLVASASGIEFDEKSGADHIGHLAANCLMYLWQKQHEAKKPEMVKLTCDRCQYTFITEKTRFYECLSCGGTILPPASQRLGESFTSTPFGESLKLLRELADMQNDAPLERYRKEWEETMKEVYALLEKWEEPVDLSGMKFVFESCNSCHAVTSKMVPKDCKSIECCSCKRVLHI